MSYRSISSLINNTRFLRQASTSSSEETRSSSITTDDSAADGFFDDQVSQSSVSSILPPRSTVARSCSISSVRQIEVPDEVLNAAAVYDDSDSNETLDGIDDSETQRDLRLRITAIRDQALSEKESAMLVQELMMGSYRMKQLQAGESRESHAAFMHREVPLDYMTVPSLADLEITYHDESSNVLGCAHYRRYNKLQCNTCGKWVTCRFCHDEVEDHTLQRSKTKYMLCMLCRTPQKAAADCKQCGQRMARYYCDKCKLWDDEPTKSIYHCDECGICRIGEGLGKDYYHCQKCGVCISISLQYSHRCIERNLDCDCPICGEYLFSSTKTVVFMVCGHAIHQACYEEHMKTSYKCPTCARTVINMDAQFRLLDNEILMQHMPPPYDQWKSDVICNDCSWKSRVRYHFLGHKCNSCGSYNTSISDILKWEAHPGALRRRSSFSHFPPSDASHLPTVSSSSSLSGLSDVTVEAVTPARSSNADEYFEDDANYDGLLESWQNWAISGVTSRLNALRAGIDSFPELTTYFSSISISSYTNALHRAYIGHSSPANTEAQAPPPPPPPAQQQLYLHPIEG